MGIDSARHSRFSSASRENGHAHDAESMDQPHFTWRQVTVKLVLKMQLMAQLNTQFQSQHSQNDYNLVKTTTELWPRFTGLRP